jgi:hypothetical protein
VSCIYYCSGSAQISGIYPKCFTAEKDQAFKGRGKKGFWHDKYLIFCISIINTEFISENKSRKEYYCILII